MSSFNEKLSAAYEKASEAKNAAVLVVISSGLDHQERLQRLKQIEDAYWGFLNNLVCFSWERTEQEQKDADDYSALMKEMVVEEGEEE